MNPFAYFNAMRELPAEAERLATTFWPDFYDGPLGLMYARNAIETATGCRVREVRFDPTSQTLEASLAPDIHHVEIRLVP